ncbi:Adenylosuccinate synthetase [Sedimentisphaera cyanobacteriorum]|uniref:Adenylosuccinate synthetase n=1 Tax=Sedimentisphaera cyanobacteriorum TaxID=1940790 RepID=A0A1Q2HRD7_9BACT|nr:adenylosuccinate synthase [Sedimentisphaera cyanobacteriorum]AQQ09795.1 Adenylosuccinate synthetase [Sedimentisphaera cyanobacteriorum]
MNCCVTGLQWGDEGKGKVVDILAEQCDVVVRFAGGANAGHTVIVNNQKFALHLMPSGAVRSDTACVIGNGVVFDPEIFLKELEGLEEKGFSFASRLFISENAHVVLSYHKLEDSLRESALGKNKIGTTNRGIGPCYADKIGRSFAVRVADFRSPEELKKKLNNIIEYKNKVFSAVYGAEPIDPEEVYQSCQTYSKKLGKYICNTTKYLHEAIASGKKVLFEGAQGALLDLDHGTFPFVTSSNASALGMSTGSGIPSSKVERFLGVVKAYTTRVGSGPFPTEQDNQTGQLIRDKGNEYGTTTGRPRRCGWFDGVAARYAAAIGGINELAVMHLDTLAGMEELKICPSYMLDGEETNFFPVDAGDLERAECVYETFAGWSEDLSEVKEYEKLPENAKRYIEALERITGVRVSMIGTGPRRDQIIYKNNG